MEETTQETGLSRDAELLSTIYQKIDRSNADIYARIDRSNADLLNRIDRSNTALMSRVDMVSNKIDVVQSDVDRLSGQMLVILPLVVGMAVVMCNQLYERWIRRKNEDKK